MSSQANACQHSWYVSQKTVYVDGRLCIYKDTIQRHKSQVQHKTLHEEMLHLCLGDPDLPYAQRYNSTNSMKCSWTPKGGTTAQAISVRKGNRPWIVEVGTSHHGVLHMLLHAVQRIQDCAHTALSVCSAAFISCGLGDHSYSAKLSHLKTESQRSAQLFCLPPRHCSESENAVIASQH